VNRLSGGCSDDCIVLGMSASHGRCDGPIDAEMAAVDDLKLAAL
jgi:hypothetical protein